MTAGIVHFKRAIELDSAYAPGHVGLADSNIVLGNFGTYRPRDIYPAAKDAALKALELDDTLGDAHASLGLLQSNYEWDWVGAAQAFRRALDLRPGYANAHHWYALDLSVVGRSDEALGAIEGHGGAPAVAERLLVAGTVLLLKGSYPEALAALRRANVLLSTPMVTNNATLGYTHAKMGEPDKALAIAAALEDRYQRTYASPVFIAVVYVGLGDHPRAFRWLERACDDRDGWLRVLKIWPFFDDIRDAPEFLGLLRRIGLAAS